MNVLSGSTCASRVEAEGCGSFAALVADDDGEVSVSEGSVLLVGSVSGACARRRS